MVGIHHHHQTSCTLFLFVVVACTISLHCRCTILAEQVDAAEAVNATESKFQSPCDTPNGDQGLCLEFDKCPAFAGGVIDENDIESQEFLAASECQASNARIKTKKYCCGKLPFTDHLRNVACGERRAFSFTIDNRIVGGVEAELGEFPWIVRMVHKRNGRKNLGCGGFLVHPEFAITAAHCFRPEIMNAFGNVTHVRLGEHNTDTNPDCANGTVRVCAEPFFDMPVSTVKVHSGYNLEFLNNNNDIALIRFKNPINFTNYIQPICLSEEAMDADEYWLSGWGKTEDSDSSNVKRKVKVLPMRLDECIDKYKTINIDLHRSNHLCAGGQVGKDSCSGDSGGPLMLESNGKWYARGVVSFGVGCGREHWPGVYSNLRAYTTWVKKVIAHKISSRNYRNEQKMTKKQQQQQQ